MIPARTLPCGCLVDDYRTSRGATVITIHAVAPDCHAPRHRIKAVLSMIGVIAGDADPDTETHQDAHPHP
jgi:hypothetical protein